jgi:hypothetical protein
MRCTRHVGNSRDRWPKADTQWPTPLADGMTGSRAASIVTLHALPWHAEKDCFSP